MTAADAQSYRDRQAAAALSWETMTASQVRDKIRAIEAVPSKTMREVYARILAHALVTHCPQHLGLLPPDWITP